MNSKVSTKCNKASTLIITNYDDNKTEKKKKGFSENFAKDYITKSVRETRYFEMIQNMSATTKVAPLYLGSQSYQELFKKLIESCRSFFTKEYGKSEEDYNMFVENCTKTYEIPKRHERSLVFERMRLYKYDTEYGKKDTASVVSMKKSKTSIVPRHKSKGECMKNRSRQVSACKRSKSLYKRMKKSKKADAYGTVFERSASDLIDSSEEEQRRGSIKDAPKKLKPFVYKLSDPEMIKNGITVNYQLPKRLVTFVAHPACRHTFWFQTRIEPLEKYYPNGNISWRHDTDGTATVYYENGEPAISFIYGRIGPLIIVYTKSEKIRDRIIKQVPVALFDTRGNGVVYNKKTGKKRLLYDQAQGILLDTPSKCPISWKWKCYNQVQCRRAELNFVSPTHLDDYDFGKRKTRITKNIENLQRKSKKRRITSIWEPRKSRFRKKSRRTEYLNMLKYKRRYTSKMASSKSELSCASIKKKFSMNNSILRDIDVPKVIRFVGRKIVIKPIFTPCSEIEAIITNVASSPSHRTLFDSAAASTKISSKPTSRGAGQKFRLFGHSDDRLFREPLTRCKHKRKRKCVLKPIVLNLTDKISLTITEQEHIHIDFISHPMHYIFNIGVEIFVDKSESIFDVRIPNVNKDYIPSVLEALKTKCPILHNINRAITNVRNKAQQKSRRDCIRSLKAWGQDKYLGKVPLCKLMNNKCSCRDCNCIPENIETI